ncbi:MAG: glycosyltransferase [Verrucomicrobiae bacterium]|nr:glycosyltransferase [Verrucomicrobiae bacterium]
MLTESQTRPRILITHPWMGWGGSEATAMWSIQALQDLADVTFTTASPLDLGQHNAIYGTSVSPEKVTVRQAPKLPGIRSGTQLVYWQHASFERFCRHIAKNFDVCLSAYNPVYFGKPGIQLIGDFSFSEKARQLLYPNAEDRICHRQSLLRRIYLTAGECLKGWGRPTLAERGDCAVANSFWTAKKLEKIFRLPATPVLYPPSIGSGYTPSEKDDQRDPWGFVCLGRISPEKEIETIIAIMDRVRSQGYPVNLDLVGSFGDDDYARRIRRLVDNRSDWIRTPGFLNPKEKAKLFASRTFAIHGCRVEAFGIAVAEMADSGLIPIVPRSGGAAEIVDHPDLIYSSSSEGVKKILDLLQSPEHHPRLREQLHHRVARFHPERFMNDLVEIVGDFWGRPLTASPRVQRHVAKNLTTTF